MRFSFPESLAVGCVIGRREFFFLYANLSGIAELGFWHMTLKVLVASPEEPRAVEKPLTQDEPAATVLEGFDDIDFSVLEPVDINASLSLNTLVFEQPDVEPPEEYNELSDIERYLTRAYASEEKLRERVDAYYKNADLLALEAGLGELPSQMPPLTEPMSAVEMESWVERYADADLALTELTVKIRRLSDEMPQQ